MAETLRSNIDEGDIRWRARGIIIDGNSTLSEDLQYLAEKTDLRLQELLDRRSTALNGGSKAEADSCCGEKE